MIDISNITETSAVIEVSHKFKFPILLPLTKAIRRVYIGAYVEENRVGIREGVDYSNMIIAVGLMPRTRYTVKFTGELFILGVSTDEHLIDTAYFTTNGSNDTDITDKWAKNEGESSE